MDTRLSPEEKAELTEKIRARTAADRDKAIEMVACVMCFVSGINPIEPLDGGPNWWMFQGEAEKIVDDLRARFPGPGQTIQ